jgi:hypothetical protein
MGRSYKHASTVQPFITFKLSSIKLGHLQGVWLPSLAFKLSDPELVQLWLTDSSHTLSAVSSCKM